MGKEDRPFLESAGDKIMFRLDHMVATAVARTTTGAHASTSRDDGMPNGQQRLFDIARIYGGQLMEIPAKSSPKRSVSAHTTTKPHSERSAPSVRVGTASPGAKGAPPAAMGTTLMRVEEERLEALRRKNEREMQLLIAQEEEYERRTQEADHKVAKAKAREDERNRIRRLEAERERQEAEARIAEKREDDRRKEEELQRIAKQRYLQEQHFMELKRKEMAEQAKAAAQREYDRNVRLEQLKAQTAAILAEQAAEVQKRKEEMDARDRERAEHARLKKIELEEKAAEKRAAFEAKRKAAELRNAQLLEQKRAEFEEREAAAAARAEALARVREEEAALRAEIEKERNEHLAAVAREAAELEEKKVAALEAKKLAFEERAAMLKAQREKEMRERAEAALQAEADRVAKLQTLHRWREDQSCQLEAKIEDQMEKVQALITSKKQMVAARKVGAVKAQITRQQMKADMEMARRKRWAAAHPGSPFDLMKERGPSPDRKRNAPGSPGAGGIGLDGTTAAA